MQLLGLYPDMLQMGISRDGMEHSRAALYPCASDGTALDRQT
ncbi:MAG: hypothetical protein WDA24_12540 [Tissierellales bacterium]